MILFTITFTRDCDEDENGDECPLLKWQIELPAGALPHHALAHFYYEVEDDDEEEEVEIEVHDVTWEGD